MESYYTRFYKMMNEMIRNNLTVATMQVNVQFLQQLQPEWSRFVTIVKQQHKLDEVSYHKLVHILKQYQKEVNEIHVERIAKHANPLALVAAAQPYQDPYYQAPKSYKSYAPTSKASLPTRSHATTRNKGKEIAKPITPPSESASEEDSDPEQAQKDKEMQKNLALIAKYFKKLYKPTNNNIRTSSNTRNKNVDTTLRYKNDNQTGQIRNQRTMTVAGARETVGSQEFRKPKRVKDSTYHKEKMLLCKQAKKGVPLQAEQSDWLVDTDEEIYEQELEAHYNYMTKIHDIQNDQNDVECDDERVALANLIANLKLDVDENKKIQKQLKKANTTLAHELTECKSILAETSRTLKESNSIRDSCLVALQNKQTELEKYKTFNDRTVDYEKLEHKLNETLGLLAQKDIDIKEGLKLKAYEISVVKEKHDELVKQSLLTKSHYEGLVKDKTKVITDLKLKEEKDIDKMISMEKQLKFLNEIVYKRSQSIQTIHMLAPKCPTFNGRPTFANPMCLKKAQSEIPCLYEIPHDQSDPANSLILDREETLTLERESREKLNKDLVKPYDYTKELVDQAWVKHSKDRFRAPTAHDMEILIKTCLMPLALKTQNDSFAFVHELKQEMHADLKYVESLEKEVDELESDKAEFSNMFTKKPKVMPISTRKPKSQVNKSIATHHKKTVASESTVQNSKIYYRMLYEKTSKAWKWWIEQQCPSGYKWVPKIKMKWVPKVRNEICDKERVSFAIDNASRITNHMTGNLTLLCNFVEKYMGTVRFGNDQFAPILGYGDLVQGNITINKVYYVEGLNHNLFLVGQFCDADLEVAFRKSTCFVRDLQGNDLLTGNRRSDLYTISLQETTSSTLICLMAKASPTQAWLWHRRLSHLNFDYINLLSKKDVVIGLPKLKYVKDQLCSSCEVSKAKRSSFKTKTVPSSKGRLNLLHMDLCGPMRVASINGKKYILFLNKTLHAFFKEEGIEHQTSTPRTPEQNGVVERQNRTLVEAARTMLSASKLPLFFWAEAIATACYTQNRSIIIPTYEKMAYHITNDRKPLIKHIHIFGCTCYLTIDGENLDKMKEKGDPCILIKEMSKTSIANDTSGLVPQRQKASDYDNSDPDPQLQNVSPLANTTVPSQQELDLLFGPLYDEFFNAGTSRVNKSASPTDNSAQQDTLPSMIIHPTIEPSTPIHVNAKENNNDQAEFINPFCTLIQEVAESSSRNIGNLNMHTFNQPQDSEYRWTKGHPLTQVHGNPSKPVQTR
ncbi:reverse transcriptase domain-containing protein [Tanacetum coccineum]